MRRAPNLVVCVALNLFKDLVSGQARCVWHSIDLSPQLFDARSGCDTRGGNSQTTSSNSALQNYAGQKTPSLDFDKTPRVGNHLIYCAAFNDG
jgi:hypothetical protein